MTFTIDLSLVCVCLIQTGVRTNAAFIKKKKKDLCLNVTNSQSSVVVNVPLRVVSVRSVHNYLPSIYRQGKCANLDVHYAVN